MARPGLCSHPSKRSTRRLHQVTAWCERATRVSHLTLLRVGFTKPTELPRLLVSSYLTVSPLPVLSPSRVNTSAVYSHRRPRIF